MKKINLGLFLLLIIIIGLTGCRKENIKIGFVGNLTTKNSQLAIDARNAIELAVEETNDNGGIHGVKIQLVSKDDKGDVDSGKLADKEFKEEGVEFVIGHMSSNMIEPIIKSQGPEMLFISPSITTDELSDIDDYFLRTAPTNSQQAVLMADYLNKSEINNIVVAYETSNKSYSENLFKMFEKKYIAQGNTITKSFPYNTKDTNLNELADEIIETNTQAIWYICQATDTAMLQQYIKKDLPNIKSYSVSWSMTKDLIANGGASVENMIFVGAYQPIERSFEYEEFKRKFKNRYNYEPSFISELTYDAYLVLVDGLTKADKLTPTEVKNEILSTKIFEGLSEEFEINILGDSNKKYMLYKLIDEVYIPLEEW